TNTSTTFGTVSSPTSDYDYSWTPTAVGTYTLTFNFLATNITVANDPTSSQLGDEYLPTTTSTTLVVQSTPIAAIPPTPLPTAFWSRPIYGENSNWYILGSNWLGFGSPGYISIGSGPNLGANGEEFGQHLGGDQYQAELEAKFHYFHAVIFICPESFVKNKNFYPLRRAVGCDKI
ncbi:MAG: hypothetical protein ABSG42_06420, partial [Nitrospirota bacterium]